MIPRYVPAFPSFAPRVGDGREPQWRECVLAALAGPGAGWCDCAFPELRHALHAYFARLRAAGARSDVLMSAQICPVVPLAARAAGLRPRFVDIAECAPSPDAAQYVSALDAEVAAVLVAPFYGHLATGWAALTANLGGARLVIDLAQGIGLGERAAPLIARADALGFSFGLGKGVDAGGALLLTREPLQATQPRAHLAPWYALRPAALWLLAASGLYSLIPRNAIESSASAGSFVARSGAGPIVPEYARWSVALEEFLRAVDLARTRARVLAESAFAASVKCRSVCFDPGSTHLRQVVRVSGAAARDALLQHLRRAGVDCAAAGEPLPHEYMGDVPSGSNFPNALGFKAESIRLPFLGRLNDSRFARLRAALETGFGRLPH